jgi:hypothetical protein
MDMARYLLVTLILLSLKGVCWAQTDTIPAGFIAPNHPASQHPADTSRAKRRSSKNLYKIDTAARRIHDPSRATWYSIFCPGLGQFYNRKYWKIPIVWAAVGIPAYTYFDNRNWYHKTQAAISLMDTYATLNEAIPDSLINKFPPNLQTFLRAGPGYENQLRTARNAYRQYEDYSALFFILFYGLQIIDATVDAHLMGFDISNQLSVNFQQPSAPATLAGPMGPGMGISLVFDFHKPRFKTLPPRP